MFISKKKFNEKVMEKVHEALERESKERWIHERIDSVEKEFYKRVEGVQSHCFELEKKIALLLDEKKPNKRRMI